MGWWLVGLEDLGSPGGPYENDDDHAVKHRVGPYGELGWAELGYYFMIDR